MARRTRDLTVGVVFALALSIFAIGVMSVGSGVGLLKRTLHYKIVFENADGLSIGSPVKMAGVQIGTVTDLELPTDPGRAGIQAEVGIDKDYAARVREDSRAALRTLQILTGEKVVEISPGSPDATQLPEDATIELAPGNELFQQAQDAAQDLSQITASLRKILEDVSQGEGLLGQVLTNPELAEEGFSSLQRAFFNLESTSDQLLQAMEGRGLIARLLKDEETAAILDDVAVSMERVRAISEGIDPNSGLLGALTQDDGQGSAILDDLQTSARNLREFSDGLRPDTGLLGKLMHDPAYGEAVADDLRLAARNLAEITDKINSGQGTLGALVNERELHDDLEVMMSGVNDSKFTRWLLRRYRRKGVESLDAATAGDPPAVPPAAGEGS